MKDKLVAIENAVKTTAQVSQDWKKKLAPAIKHAEQTEREHLRLQEELRTARTNLEAIESSINEVDDMSYLRAKAAVERLVARVARAGEERAKARKNVNSLAAEWHADVAHRRSTILLDWRKLSYEGEDELKRELNALG